MIQKQTQFTGGINTLYPKHKIPDGFSVDLVDADVFDGTIKNDESFGGSGGGASYYYEAGETWVGPSGFANRSVQDQLIVNNTTGNLTSTTHVGSGTTATFNSPLKIDFGFEYKIQNNHTITIVSATRGLFNANSFVEYNRDLYVGRDQYFIDVASVNNLSNGTCEVTLTVGEVGKVHQGDEIAESDYSPSFTEITEINYTQNKITLNTHLVYSGSAPTRLAVDAIPIRVIDGNLNNSYPLGLKPPTPKIDFQQIGSNTDRNNSHTTFWYATNQAFYPIPYQYGLAKYDLATGAESGMSELTDSSFSAQNLLKDTNHTNRPAKILISGVDQGQYALYRTGGTSSVLKKVATLGIGYGVTKSITYPTAGTVRISLSNLPPGRCQLNVYPYQNTSYNYAPTLVEIPSNGQLSFDLVQDHSTAPSNHYVDVFIEVELMADPFKRISTVGALTIENSVATDGHQTTNHIDFIDFTPPQTLIDIQPITAVSMPPTNMKFLTEVNNFFFGVEGRRLYISRYADPNNWPLDGYLTFDNLITALSKRGSDLLVFTTFNLYRVFGSSPTSMRKIKIPTVDGCPAGLHKCVQPVGNGVVYVSQNGLQLFNGAEVINLTEELIPNFTPPSPNYINNVSGVLDNKYYLLSALDNGYILNLKKGVRVTRSKLKAYNLHYRGNTNKLYNETGYLGGGSKLSFQLASRNFDGGDISKLKIFKSFRVIGEDFENTGSFEFYVDDVLQKTASCPSAATLSRRHYLDYPSIGHESQIKLIDIKGRVFEIEAESELLESFSLKRWVSVEIQYIGTLTVSVGVDNIKNQSHSPNLIFPITNKTLPLTHYPQTIHLFFPPMTEGEIAHIVTTETEANQILEYNFQAEEI